MSYPIDADGTEAILLAVVTKDPVVLPGVPDEHLEVAVEGRTVARLAWEGTAHRVVALRCHRAAHGVLPAFKRLADKLEELSGQRIDPEDCETCGGTGWVPVDKPEARTVATAALFLRMFRGIVLSKDTDALEKLKDHVDAGTMFGSLLGGFNNDAR